MPPKSSDDGAKATYIVSETRCSLLSLSKNVDKLIFLAHNMRRTRKVGQDRKKQQRK